MGRIKADPVDIAFRAWANLDDAQKQRLADRVAGYQEARGVVAIPAPRTRQRKMKPDAITGAIAKEHDRLNVDRNRSTHVAEG